GQPATPGNRTFSLDGSNSFTGSPFIPPGSSGGNVQILQTTNFGTNQITESSPLPAGWTLTNILVQSRLGTSQPPPSGLTANLNPVQGDTLWVTFPDTFNGTSSTATTIVDAATGTPLPGSPALGMPDDSVRDTAVVTFNPAASPSAPTPTGTVIYTFTGAALA